MKKTTLPLWKSDEIAAVLGLVKSSDWDASGVSIDSRQIAPDELFVALIGERFNGHAYVNAALENGAKAAIVSEVPAGMKSDDKRLIKVENTEVSLQRLGMAARARTKAQIVGVTGSVGKTGAKEMLRVALGANGSVYATKGNLNNHLGVPLSLANMPLDTDYAVMEMGMNHSGEIRLLSQWVKPHVSIITTIEAAHLEFFSGIEAIADAKAEIFEGMNKQGVAILNSDNSQFDRLRRQAVKCELDRVLSFGVGEDALCRMVQYSTEGLESIVEAVIAGTRIHYHLGAIGRHWGLMSVAVLAAVDALGADLPKAAAALRYFHEPEGRGRISELAVNGGYLRLIDDSYNASPAAMEAAFEKVKMIRDGDSDAPRTLAILGDMLELGDRSRDLHVGLAPTLVNNQIDLVFAAGHFMKHLYDALPESMRGDYDPTAMGLGPKVVQRLRPRDLVLVKGSHGSRMHEVVHAIEGNARRLEVVTREKLKGEGADAL